MQKCDVSYEISQGITKHVLMWMSSRGVEFFDGNTISGVSEDVRNYFDSTSSTYINTAMLNSFSSFYDERNYEYHLLIATGSSTVLDTELVYNLLKKKWYLVDRGTNKRLGSAWDINDKNGYSYNYGGASDGYIYRLENGTTFDGNPIVSTLFLSDMPIADTLNYMTEVRHLKIVGVSKANTTNNINVTYYLDGDNTGVALSPVSPGSSTRLYDRKFSVGKRGVTHSIKATMSTTNETIGFEPLFFSVLWKTIREDIF